MTETQILISEIETAATALKMSTSTLCAKAVGNGHLVKRLHDGQSCSLETAARIRRFIRENPPAVVGAP